MKHKLVSPELATQIDPMLLSEAPVPKWYAEAGDAALDADVSVSFDQTTSCGTLICESRHMWRLK
jgi:hypothetical protein